MSIREQNAVAGEDPAIIEVSTEANSRDVRQVPAPRLRAIRASATALCYSDTAGIVWQVFEWPLAADDGDWIRPSLIFLSDDKFRRVRSYPRDWRTLDAGGLETLSWHR